MSICCTDSSPILSIKSGPTLPSVDRHDGLVQDIKIVEIKLRGLPVTIKLFDDDIIGSDHNNSVAHLKGVRYRDRYLIAVIFMCLDQCIGRLKLHHMS